MSDELLQAVLRASDRLIAATAGDVGEDEARLYVAAIQEAAAAALEVHAVAAPPIGRLLWKIEDCAENLLIDFGDWAVNVLELAGAIMELRAALENRRGSS